MKKIIKKRCLNWLVSDNSLIAFDRLQATIYHSFDMPNKQPLEEMRDSVLNSKKDEYGTWADVIDLAMKKGMHGYGTRLRDEWFGES